MTHVLKLLGAEIDINTTANTCGNNTLVRVVNTGAAATINVAYSNGVVYANTTVTNTQPVYIEKAFTDTVVGANMKATPIAYRN